MCVSGCCHVQHWMMSEEQKGTPGCHQACQTGTTRPGKFEHFFARHTSLKRFSQLSSSPQPWKDWSSTKLLPHESESLSMILGALLFHPTLCLHYWWSFGLAGLLLAHAVQVPVCSWVQTLDISKAQWTDYLSPVYFLAWGSDMPPCAMDSLQTQSALWQCFPYRVPCFEKSFVQKSSCGQSCVAKHT